MKPAWVIGVLIPLVACGGQASPPTAPAPALIVYEVGNGVSAPTVVTNVKPVYPSQALAARVQGNVLLSAVVLPDGTVGDVTVIRSADTQFGLDAAAIAAVKQWRFNPGLKDGVPVAVRVSIEVTFSIA